MYESEIGIDHIYSYIVDRISKKRIIDYYRLYLNCDYLESTSFETTNMEDYLYAVTNCYTLV